jgi:hypothetical protein
MNRTTLCSAADAALPAGTTGLLLADGAQLLATPTLALAGATAVGAAGGIVTVDVMGGMMGGGKDGEEDPAAPPATPGSYRGASASRLLALR